MTTKQPKWRVVLKTDHIMLRVDDTGVYDAEAEIAEEYSEDGAVKFQVYRFGLEKYKVVYLDDNYIVPDGYEVKTWPHPAREYEPWFLDDLSAVAATSGSTVATLRRQICSDNVFERLEAYEAIGSHFGLHNFDDYPLTLTEQEFDKRWNRYRVPEQPKIKSGYAQEYEGEGKRQQWYVSSIEKWHIVCYTPRGDELWVGGRYIDGYEHHVWRCADGKHRAQIVVGSGYSFFNGRRL